MMQEVACDDGNGESTFEFVEEKIEGLSIADDNSNAPTQQPPTETSINQLNPTTQYTQPTAPSSTDTFASVAPPSALPNFINFQGSTNTTHSASSPITSINPGPPPMMQQFRASVPPPQMMNTASSNYTYAAPNPYSMSAAQQLGHNYPPPTNTVTVVRSQGPQSQIPPPRYQVVQSQPVAMYSQSQCSPSVAVPFGDYDFVSQQQVPSYYGEADNKGLLGWIKGSMPGGDFISKVAEKAKHSVDSMITTLDPQMKEYIHSGGDVDVVVTTNDEDIVSGVREAFQAIFGRATVRSVMSHSPLAPQLVGFSAGQKSVEERIQQLRQGGLIHEHQPVVAVDHFLAELTPDRWYDMSCLMLHDPARSVQLFAYTQPIPIPNEAVQKIQEETPADYPLRWCGLSVNISSALSHMFQVPHSEYRETLTGVTTRDLIVVGAKTLASQYKLRMYSNRS